MPCKASVKELTLNDYLFDNYLDLNTWNLAVLEFASVGIRVAGPGKARVGSVLTEASQVAVLNFFTIWGSSLQQGDSLSYCTYKELYY